MNDREQARVPGLTLRILCSSDLDFADSLRARVGWNQTRADWERFLAINPDGCFLAEWNGVPVGTATTTIYGLDLAWIGMVLVHPDYRRRGIGRDLLKVCLGHLRSRGIRCVKLDATPAGQLVYETMGFRSEGSLTRWRRAAGAADWPTSDRSLRLLCPEDWLALEALDARSFGVRRVGMLAALVSQGRCALAWTDEEGRPVGFGVLREGARALYLGPVTAANEAAGSGLVEALVAKGAGQAIYWDIPDLNIAATAWAQAHGFVRERPLTRMFLGTPPAVCEVGLSWAITGPETG